MSFDLNDFVNKSGFDVFVKTNQRKSSVDFVDDLVVVSVKSKSENNLANLEVERVLSKFFGKSVKIIKGKTSRKKVVVFA
jgi:uncharacterized protein YggU (UPF0235/DUF167 family)